jgi:cell division protein ZapD
MLEETKDKSCQSVQDSGLITFEQPLNEYVRVCLRLEQLLQKIKEHIHCDTLWDCRIALETLLEVVNVIDRTDIKNKLTKTMRDQMRALSLLEQKPEVDGEKLRNILSELNELITRLCSTQDKMGQSLRINNFLNSIRQHLTLPGGVCDFNNPAYYLWLKRSKEQRCAELLSWFKEFEHLQAIVKLLLQLTRASSNPQSVIAYQGFYQQSLDPNLSCQLIQIIVPVEAQVYPEVSVGKHRLSVRFLNLADIQARPTQSIEVIAFDLKICVI